MNANSNFAFLAADRPELHAEAPCRPIASVPRPSTDLHAQGPEGVFTPAPVDDVFAAIDSLAPKQATG